MSFADVEIRDGSKQTFQKIMFLDLPQGQSLIRILDADATKFHTHFINKSTIKCLGDNCPVCLNNKRLIVEHPEDFRNIKGYYPYSQRFFVNVLDLTPVKVCTSCGKENKKTGGQFSPTCTCGAFIVNVKETVSNKVKLWGFGARVAARLNEYEKGTLDADGNPIPLNTFDFMLMVTGQGTQKDVMPVPMLQSNKQYDVPEDALFDTSKAVISLEHDEIIQFMKGISLKDIFAARKGAKAEVEEKALTDEIRAKVADRISQIM